MRVIVEPWLAKWFWLLAGMLLLDLGRFVLWSGLFWATRIAMFILLLMVVALCVECAFDAHRRQIEAEQKRPKVEIHKLKDVERYDSRKG